jgi:hypothetical protein
LFLKLSPILRRNCFQCRSRAQETRALLETMDFLLQSLAGNEVGFGLAVPDGVRNVADAQPGRQS